MDENLSLTADLRRRLDEAEETIRAIREGEVDALVIRNRALEEEVFTLEGGPEPFRAFMEAMDLGAAAFDAEGRLLYANASLGTLLGVTAEALHKRGLPAVLDAASAATVRDLMGRGAIAKSMAEITVDGGRHIQVSASPLRVGLTDAVAVTFTDITHRIRERASQESERAALAILASANEAVIVCDLSGTITHANAAVAAIAAQNPVGKTFAEAVPLKIAGATGPHHGSEIVALAIGGNPVKGIEAFAPQAPKTKELLVSAAPLRIGSDAISGCVVTMIDLTQRKALEKQQLLLMGELDHRVKNTLALVLSIANRTANAEETVSGFQTAFSGRIQALAATHNILAERSWSSVRVGEVLSQEVEPFITSGENRLRIAGPDVRIRPRAAIALGLVLHELATNAVKYGALSSPAGIVAVQLTNDLESPFFSLEWREQDGPAVAEPNRFGFGQTVITRSQQNSVDGGAVLEYPSEGVRCTMRIPRADVVAGV
jgi:PAS domain S-box-containing protein